MRRGRATKPGKTEKESKRQLEALPPRTGDVWLGTRNFGLGGENPRVVHLIGKKRHERGRGGGFTRFRSREREKKRGARGARGLDTHHPLPVLSKVRARGVSPIGVLLVRVCVMISSCSGGGRAVPVGEASRERSVSAKTRKHEVYLQQPQH